MLLNRKHHCRACGGIFCGECSKWEIEFTALSRIGEEGYQEKKKRVCEPCHSKITEAHARAQDAETRARLAVAAVDAIRDKLGSFLMASAELTDEQRALQEELEKKEAEADLAENEHMKAGKAILDAQGQEEPLEPEKPEVDMTGAYLVFSPECQGIMYMIWSKVKVDGALAYGRPGMKVPDFKFAKGGKWELYRNINGNKSAYYQGWAMFVKRCQKFECLITDFGGEGRVLPVSLVLHFNEGLKIRRMTPGEETSLEGVGALAAIHTDFAKLDIDNTLRNNFLALGREGGAATELD
jgi:hypothetical protein